MTERAVETDPEDVEMDVEYRPDRLAVRLEARTIEFRLDRGRQLATLETDTQQVDASPTDIPDAVLEHVLAGGWRLEVPTGERDYEGEHTVWIAD